VPHVLNQHGVSLTTALRANSCAHEYEYVKEHPGTACLRCTVQRTLGNEHCVPTQNKGRTQRVLSADSIRQPNRRYQGHIKHAVTRGTARIRQY